MLINRNDFTIVNDFTIIIYLMIVYCGSPIVYLLGIEENRKKTKIIIMSKIRVFENKVHKCPKVIHEENKKCFPIMTNNWI